MTEQEHRDRFWIGSVSLGSAASAASIVLEKRMRHIRNRAAGALTVAAMNTPSGHAAGQAYCLRVLDYPEGTTGPARAVDL